MNYNNIFNRKTLRTFTLPGLLLVLTGAVTAQAAMGFAACSFHCGAAGTGWSRMKIHNSKLAPYLCHVENKRGGKAGIVIFSGTSILLKGGKYVGTNLVEVSNDKPPAALAFRDDVGPDTGTEVRKLKLKVIMQAKDPDGRTTSINLTGSDLKFERTSDNLELYWIDPKKLQAKDDLKFISRIYAYLPDDNRGELTFDGAILQQKDGKRQYLEAIDLKSHDCSVLDNAEHWRAPDLNLGGMH